MLMASNSAKDVIIKTNQDKYGICLVSTLAIAAQGPIISQSYEEFVPYTEMLINSDSNIMEVSFFDLDGKYLANANKEKTKKLGEKSSSEMLNTINYIEKPIKLESLQNNYIDYIAPIKIGTSKFGTVLIKLENISTK